MFVWWWGTHSCALCRLENCMPNFIKGSSRCFYFGWDVLLVCAMWVCLHFWFGLKSTLIFKYIITSVYLYSLYPCTCLYLFLITYKLYVCEAFHTIYVIYIVKHGAPHACMYFSQHTYV